jgi:DNA (cytosine-5)-methyltransferase 1
MPLAIAVKLWPTPTVHGNHNRKGASKESGDGLATAVKRWPTPNATDGKGPSTRTPGKERPTCDDDLPTRAGGALNPTWVEWLMGFPLGWTDLEDSGTPSSLTSPTTSGV